MILNCTVFSTFGGRDSVDPFSNVFLIRTSLALTDPKFETCGLQLATLMGTIMVDRARILRVVFSQTNGKNTTKTNNGTFVPVPVDVVGQRQLAIDEDPATINVCALFNKSAPPGNFGRQLIRGVYGEDDVESSTQLYVTTSEGFSVAPLTAFAAALPGIFTTNNMELVLPAPSGSDFVTGARPVTKVTYGGPTLKQRRNSRRSIKGETKDLAKRELAAVNHEYQQALKDARDRGLAAVAETIITHLVQQVVKIAIKYGISYITGRAAPKALGPIIDLALKALPAGTA